ncbi:MAG: hypothetical protein RLZZ367_1595 [Bacteroidota bacterium]|jgi:glutathione peroxidase
MAESIYDIELKGLDGRPVKLSTYKGKVLLIVNIASKCGQTPQLKELQNTYKKYRDKGFEILAFPSNDFAQEPKEGAQILEFCTRNYGVEFKIFAKNKVRGKNAQPLYRYLAGQTSLLGLNIYPMWNFHKYVIDRNGRFVDWFNPWKWPNDDKIAETIENCLNN